MTKMKMTALLAVALTTVETLASVTVTFDANGGLIGGSYRRYGMYEDREVGNPFGEFPYSATRDGWDFLGWFTEEESGARVTEDSPVPASSTTLFAHWGVDLQTALDNWDLTFASGSIGGLSWIGRACADAINENAACYAETNGWNNVKLSTSLSGPGTLIFSYKMTFESDDSGWGNFYTYDNGGNAAYYYGYYWQDETWSVVTQRLMSAGSHEFSWSLSSPSGVAVWLDDIQWTPAPARVTLMFDAKGGRVNGLASKSIQYPVGGAIDSLPVPTRAGYIFGGWYPNAQLTGEPLSDGDYVPLESGTYFARWMVAMEIAADNDALVWETSDEGGWYGADEPKAVGGSALCHVYSPYAAYQSRQLKTTLSGPGTLTFRWNGSIYCQSDANTLFCHANSWTQQSLVFPGEGEHSVVWYDNSYNEGEKVWLDDVQWSPAPASVRLTFDVAGGSAVGGRTYQTGRTYADAGGLPTVSREGFYLLRWENDDGEEVGEDNYVPFVAQTLHAVWAVPLEAALDLSDEVLVDEPGSWIGVECEGAVGGSAAALEWDYADDVLALAFKGPGTLRFRWKATRWCRLDFESDESCFSSDWKNANWEEEFVECRSGDLHSARWRLEDEIYWCSDDEERFAGWLDNVRWEPAPELVTVTFDAHGGRFSDKSTRKSRVYETGDCYGEIPEDPIRSGWRFLGWFASSTDKDPVSEDDLVSWTATTFTAHWESDDLSGAVDNYELEFTTGGDADWKRQDAIAVVGGSSAQSGRIGDDEVSWMETAYAGAGYLSFAWAVSCEEWYDGLSFWLDGERKNRISGEQVTWEDQYYYLTNGVHVLRWEYAKDVSCDNGLDAGFVDNVYVKAEGEADLVDWTKTLLCSGTWATGQIERMRNDCSRRIAANPSDYEARLMRAYATALSLGENKTLVALLAEFGYLPDYFRSTLSGMLGVSSRAPQSNAAVDKMAAEVTPLLAAIDADLAAIPETLTWSVKLDAAAYGLSETVWVDAVELLTLKALVSGARAALRYAEGYDLSVDYAKVNARSRLLNRTLPELSAATFSAAAWSGVAPQHEAENVPATFRAAYRGRRVYARLEVGGGIVFDCLEARVESADADWHSRIEISQDDRVADGVYGTSVEVPDDVDMATLRVSGPYAYGYLPAAAEAKKIRPVVDGLADEWKGVPMRPAWGKVIAGWTQDDGAVKTVCLVGKNVLGDVDMADICLEHGYQKGCMSYDSDAYINWTKDGSEYSYSGVLPQYNVTCRSRGQVVELQIVFDEDPGMDLRCVSLCGAFGRMEVIASSDAEVRFDWHNAAKPTLAELLNEHGGFLSKVRNRSKLLESKEGVRSMLNLVKRADALLDRRADGKLHFFEADPELDEFREHVRGWVNKTLSSLDSTQTVDVYGELDWLSRQGVKPKGCDHVADDASLAARGGKVQANLGALWGGNVTRSLFPAFVDGWTPVIGTYADATFGGVFPGTSATWLNDALTAHAAGARIFTGANCPFVMPKIGDPHGNDAWMVRRVTGGGIVTYTADLSLASYGSTLVCLVDGKVRAVTARSGVVETKTIDLGANGVHEIAWEFDAWNRQLFDVRPVRDIRGAIVDAAYPLASVSGAAIIDKPTAGSVNVKGATYNGFLTDASGAVVGTYVLAVKKAGKDGRTATAKMTVTDLATGKKTKVSGTVDVATGAGAGGLKGLSVGGTSVSGTVGGRTAQGAADAAKAKNASALSVLEKFNKSIYGFALMDARGGVSAFTCTMGAKGKAKIAGNLANGTKVSVSTKMSVGDRCCVPFVFAKKGVKMAGALWFDKSSRRLVSASGLPSGYYLLDCGQASPGTGNYICSSSKGEVALTFNGKKFVAGKLVKISYKKGALKGTYTIETKTGKKTVKSKYTVVGVMIGSRGYGTAYSKKLGSFPIEIFR